MRWLILVLALATAGPAWCEDIVDVLRRSQDMRLASMAAAEPDSAEAQTILASFDALRRALPPGSPEVALHVIRGPVMAETLHGHVVVANEQLAGLPEDVRLFILAHEMGHVMQGHWRQMVMLYQKWVPGEVTRERTDPVNARLQRDASSLAHQQEYQADAFAAQTLQAMGRCRPQAEAGGLSCHDEMLTVFQQQGSAGDTLTHPSAGKRLAALRAHAYFTP
ncbi:M48 family metalloprotease [Ideonella sp.]|uniref:M48 family metalloprotease n=1 Tax=Ideonella sp. TaxID=1929293 RepID=UPI002B496217|nr:M48 family metalloprotease [Ideonella sp.]HJV72113.1 M48 family metalloprotease [Ideonella sp.]